MNTKDTNDSTAESDTNKSVWKTVYNAKLKVLAANLKEITQQQLHFNRTQNKLTTKIQVVNFPQMTSNGSVQNVTDICILTKMDSRASDECQPNTYQKLIPETQQVKMEMGTHMKTDRPEYRG